MVHDLMMDVINLATLNIIGDDGEELVTTATTTATPAAETEFGHIPGPADLTRPAEGSMEERLLVDMEVEDMVVDLLMELINSTDNSADSTDSNTPETTTTNNTTYSCKHHLKLIPGHNKDYD